jgi:integrase
MAVEAGGMIRVKGAAGLYRKGRAFVYRYRIGGRRREMGLGVIDLAAAKKLALRLAVMRQDGVDPIEARRKERAASRAKAPLTFRAAAKAYLEAHAPSWKHARAAKSWFNPIARYAFPVIGDMALDEIRVEHVVAVMGSAPPDVARRVRARIEAVINAAIALGQRTGGNPAAATLIAAVLPSRRARGPHFRRVELGAAPETFREILEGGSVAHAAMAFMILTAARPSEALRASWSEIDLERRLWTIPAARMKSGKAHAAPLSPAATAVLERQAQRRTGDAVFPGRGGSPLSYSAFAAAATGAGSPHGWRSVFRDWAGDVGRVDRDLAEAALAHSLGKVEAAYRRQTAVEARRPVMEAYANWLSGAGAQIIAFPGAARR